MLKVHIVMQQLVHHVPHVLMALTPHQQVLLLVPLALPVVRVIAIKQQADVLLVNQDIIKMEQVVNLALRDTIVTEQIKLHVQQVHIVMQQIVQHVQRVHLKLRIAQLVTHQQAHVQHVMRIMSCQEQLVLRI